MIGELIEEWIKGVLIDGITGNLSGLFDTVNQKVGEVAGDVGMTPQGFNSGIFNMLKNLSETVILPIAAAILALVMCYELIQMITEKNNMHDIDTFLFFKWAFKSAAAILIVANTWNIVMGIFDATQSVVNQSAGVIISDTSIDIASVLPDLESRLEEMSVGGLLGLWFQTLFVGLTVHILSICIFLVIYGRMIEIYLVTSLGPIPLSMFGNNEWRELLKVPAGAGLPSLSHYGGGWYLLGTDSGHRHGGGHIRRNLGLYGLHGSAVLLSVQDRQYFQSRIYRTLTDKGGPRYRTYKRETL